VGVRAGENKWLDWWVVEVEVRKKLPEMAERVVGRSSSGGSRMVEM
jgi:hypothetical protein